MESLFLRAFLLVSRKDVILPNIPTAAPALSWGPSSLYEILSFFLCAWGCSCESSIVQGPSPEEDFQVLGFAAKHFFDLFGNLSQDTSPVLAHTLQTLFSWSWGSADALACTGARHTEVLLQLRGVQQAQGIRSEEVSGLSYLGTV